MGRKKQIITPTPKEECWTVVRDGMMTVCPTQEMALATAWRFARNQADDEAIDQTYLVLHDQDGVLCICPQGGDGTGGWPVIEKRMV